MRQVESFNFVDAAEGVYHPEVNGTYNFLRVAFTRLGVPDPATVLKAPLDDYNTKHEAAASPNRTKTAPAERNAARKTLTDAFMDYGRKHLFFNPNVTLEDRKMLRFREPKTPAPIIPPDMIPIVVVVLSLLRQVKFKYYVLPGEHQRMGKPKGVAKFVAYYLISDTPPKDVSELVNKAEVSDGPLVLNFREADRGKKLYYVVCWAIAHNGLEGPKSQIEFVIIP
jgi:hypothetical protein